MVTSYYNTNKEGSDLKQSQDKAKTQEELILSIFENRNMLSASEAWKIYDIKGLTPLTSIRRAITNLCKRGKLLKTKNTKIGVYGKREHIYQLPIKDKGNQLGIFN